MTTGVPQRAAGLAFLAIAGTLALVFVVVARRGQSEPLELDERARTVGRIRRAWLVTLLVVAGSSFGLTLPRRPYASSRLARLGGAHPPPLDVAIVASQWAWSMSPATIPAGAIVRLQVQSTDVNHGMGIYDPAGHLVGQVQALPGFTNTLVTRFDQAGIYTLRCLEICGLGHHTMLRTFEVTA